MPDSVLLPPPIRLQAVLCGSVQPLGDQGKTSAIAKTPQPGAVAVQPHGLEGDAQADLRVHGGPEKAVHHYPFDHYAAWREDLAAFPAAQQRLQQVGAFGENLSTTGWTEHQVCWGDVVQVGRCILQVSQLRQPCWKLNLRMGVADMALRMQRSGRTGWYYRVLQPGSITAGDTLQCIERPCPDWSLRRVLEVLYLRPLDRAELTALQQLPLLPASWQRMIASRLERQQVEDWHSRTQGQDAPAQP